MSVGVWGGKLSDGSMGGKLSQRVEHFENEVDKHDGLKEVYSLLAKYYFRIISKSLSSESKP